MKFRGLWLVPCLASVLFLGSCEFGWDPGGGTEGQGVSLSGRLVTESGSPLGGAKVHLYPVDTSAGLGKRLQATLDTARLPKADSVLTKSDGRFVFADVAKGTYDLIVKGQRGDTLLSLMLRNLVLKENTDLGTDTVPVSGSISMMVRSAAGAPVQGALCRVDGTPWADRTNAQGVCEIEGVPPGTFRVTVTHPTLPSGKSRTLAVSSGNETDGGTVLMNGSVPPPDSTLNGPAHFTITSSTVALWTFNAYESGLIRDQKGSFHLTPSSASALPLAASPFGSAAVFDGATKRFSVPYDDRLNVGGTGKLTYEARIFMSQYPAASNFKSRTTLVGLYAGIALQILSDGSINLKAQKLTGTTAFWYDTLTTVPGIVPLGQWVDVGLAVDTTVLPRQVYAYVNGTPVQLYGTASNNSFRIYSAPFTIGGDSQDGQSFNGKIDEVRVSNSLVLGAGLPILPKTSIPPDPAPLDTAAGLQASQDTHVWGPSPAGSAIANTNDNQGKAAYFCIGAYDVSTVHRGLVRFDLPVSATSASIQKATLVLHVRNWLAKNVSTGNFRIDAHRLLKDWKEGTGSALDTKNSASVDGATGRERFWGSQNGSEDWSSLFIGINGTDATAAPAGTVTHPVGYTGAWTIDITDLAKFWADNPSQNFGVVLTTDMPASNPTVVDLPHFHSRDAAVADSLKPRLILE